MRVTSLTAPRYPTRALIARSNAMRHELNLGLVQKQFPILTYTHPHPGPLPSDGRGRIVRRPSADPTALGAADDPDIRCRGSLSRRTGEGQGEGRFVSTAPHRHLVGTS